MLNEKILNIPIWLWVSVIVVLFVICMQKNVKNNIVKKEGFANNDPKTIKIMNFNTNWCGWSQRFQPEWDNFTKTVLTSDDLKNVTPVDVKCDDTKNENMCNNYNVPGFPYVIAEVNGKIMSYQGERTEKALVEYVKSL